MNYPCPKLSLVSAPEVTIKWFSANALELRLSCTKPSNYAHLPQHGRWEGVPCGPAPSRRPLPGQARGPRYGGHVVGPANRACRRSRDPSWTMNAGGHQWVRSPAAKGLLRRWSHGSWGRRPGPRRAPRGHLRCHSSCWSWPCRRRQSRQQVWGPTWPRVWGPGWTRVHPGKGHQQGAHRPGLGCFACGMKEIMFNGTVWCPNSVRCPNSVTHKNSCLTIEYSKQTTQETSAIILENIYIIMITNGSYKGDYFIMKNTVKISVCEIEPFPWLIHQWLT